MRADIGREAGVSLVELLIVIVIIGLLSATIALNVGSVLRDSEDQSLKLFAVSVKAGMARFVWERSDSIKHSSGKSFDPCLVPASSGFLSEIFDPNEYGCYRAAMIFSNGLCVDPAAPLLGPIFTATNCVKHSDCAGLSWMGCGSLTGFVLRVEKDPNCPVPNATPLPALESTCTRTCPQFSISCGEFVAVP